VHHLPCASLSLCRFESDHQIGRRDEAHLPGSMRGEQPEGDRQVRFAHAARAEQDDVFTALDEAQPSEFLDLLTWCAACKGKVVGLERLE